MKIKINSSEIINILKLTSWVIFIGLCIDAGSYLFTGFYTMFINPENEDFLHLSPLFRYDPGNYLVILLHMLIISIMKVIIFFLIIKLLDEKKLNFSQPFNKEITRFIFRTSYLSFGIGIFSFFGMKYFEWIKSKGVSLPDLSLLGLASGDVWLFMAVILLIIAHILKRGIEIQTENELTI